jgi:hypothetical protein
MWIFAENEAFIHEFGILRPYANAHHCHNPLIQPHDNFQDMPQETKELASRLNLIFDATTEFHPEYGDLPEYGAIRKIVRSWSMEDC